MRNQSSSVEATGRRSRAIRRQRYPTHVQSVTYPANRRPRKKLYLLRIKIGFDSLGDMWTCIILLEYSPWQSLQERNILGL
ncbi:hypothetical protein TNCV_1000731 [Trichonephila clavipes]|nr:hypothetical protein TNCV_1000731 [Trichonephila clavipes]